MTDADVAGLLEEARGYLVGLGKADPDDPVPREEVVAQVEAVGYGDGRGGLEPADYVDAALDGGEIVAVDGGLDVAGEPDGRPDDDRDDDEGERRGADPDDGREDDASEDRTPDEAGTDRRARSVESFADAGFTGPLEPETWPPAHRGVDSWMLRTTEKRPWSPWTPDDAPVECAKHDEATTCAECEHPARYKWGSDGSREHVHADYETAREWQQMHPHASDDLVFIQREADPFGFVDGDDVRCPETGEVHPEFLRILDALGVTYADVSTSDGGVHAMYRGTLPDGVKQAVFEIDDEPFGAHEDENPTVEIYSGKHVCIATGRHVPGTGLQVREWDDDALADVLDEYDVLPETEPAEASAAAFEGFDPDEYEPSATTADETTDDIRDVFAALDQLDARTVADRTIVREWIDSRKTDDRAFAPVWAPSGYDGTANFVNKRSWTDDGERGGYGGPACMAAIDAGLVRDGDCPEAVSGETWFKAVDHLRDLGFSIPELEDDAGDTDPVAALPLGRLDALDRDEARRYAQRHGVEWPTTREARRQLRDQIHDELRAENRAVVDAPTALGKSHTVATERWLDRPGVTGGQPLVHLHPTREARDQAAAASRDAGSVESATLLGRRDACPVAGGEYDGSLSLGGVEAPEWFAQVCEGRGLPFSVAHKYLADENDQGRDLPCCAEDGKECPAIAQWDGLPRDDDGDTAVDVIHATHGFAHVPSLRLNTNLVFDERPDFRADLSHDQVRATVAAFLDEAGAPVADFERFVARARDGDAEPNEHAEHGYVSDALDHEPDREWYLEADDAHTLAPALAKAIWYALRPDEDDGDDPADANGRFSACVPHEPPRLDENARDDGGWNREWVTVVLDAQHTVRNVRVSPDLSTARSVVGLDAHPTPHLWQRNVAPDLRVEPVLSPEKRRLWRRFERGMTVVQVGDATRPLTSGEYFDPDGSEAFLRELRERYGDRFGTAITAAAVEGEIAGLLEGVGVDDPETMHYGEEKSRGDFGDEDVGALLGCIDPGDGYVLDLLAEAGLDATPETVEDDDGDEHRAHGRGFEGPDADAAAALLASVREQHVAQAAGRYARNADDPDDEAVVFVRTDATPTGFADLQVPGVEWLPTERQRAVVDELRDRPHATAREIADATDVSKEHVRRTLRRLVEDGVVRCREEAGAHGAHLYRAVAGLGDGASVGLEPEETATGDVWSSYTFALAVSRPSDADAGGATVAARERAGSTGATPGGEAAEDAPPPG